MKPWSDLGKELNVYLKLEAMPIAINLLHSKNEIPAGTRTPLKDLKVRLAHCQAQAIALKYGWTIAMTHEDLGCAVSGHTYGWEQADTNGAIRFLTKMNYASNSEAATTILQSLRTLEPGQCEAVLYAPLERTKIEPDVILLYLGPARLMRCLHGSTYHSGIPIICSFSGRAASCTEGVIAAFLDQSPKVVAPGNGDRVWATTQDHVMIYAFPASHLKDLVEGLAKTHEKGIRYPVPAFMRYQPEVGLTLPLTDIFKS